MATKKAGGSSRNTVFQESLSTYLGCVQTDTSDIHTVRDIERVYKKNAYK